MERIKNKNVQNFTKLTRKGGISLIVLVITIIVILILAAAVILTINNNNPIAEANKARYESDVSNMQAVFTNAVAKVMTHNRATVSITAGQINDTISGVKETAGEVSYTVTNAMNSENSSGTIVFDKKDNEETIFYTGKKLPIYAAGETKWYVDSEGNISLEVAGTKYGNGEIVKPFSQTVASDVGTYYGEKVLNYSTGDTALDTTLTENQVGWQIFYADTSNIYLIATDYVPYNLLPTKKVIAEDDTETVYALNKGYTDYNAYFTAMLPAYKGSEDITEKMQVLNSSYHEYLKEKNTKSENENMKAVAYMLDTTIWNKFAGSKAEYVIGGPTVEMLFKSYNEKNGTKYGARANVNGIGYEISKDVEAETVSWANYYSGMLDTSDTQYVISESGRKADGMWLASPSADSANGVMGAACDGYVNYGHYYDDYGLGFRPLVCLNSNVTLKAVTGGFEIE